MPSYNAAAVSDAVIAFKKGITLQQGRALRDNPIAIAEGAAGAPRVWGLGQGLKRIATFTDDTTISEVEFTGLPASSYFLIEVQSITCAVAGLTSYNLQVAASNDGGSTYSAFVNTTPAFTSATATNLVGRFGCLGIGRLAGLTSAGGFGASASSAAFAGPADALRFRIFADASARDIDDVVRLDIYTEYREVVL